ncbi:dephospho-CoA kinase [Candidatus Bipolaricaulota bacterium]|nr:dephospho-CoA kinase [Candidatus Bipolaricaulota bacterium]
MKVIGLAGKPGSGKSAVARELALRPAVTWVDLDPVAWSTYCGGTPPLDRLVERFGAGILNAAGEIDRARLAEAAFASPEARRDLDAIVHPAVSEAIAERIREESALGTEVLLVEGALLATSPYVDRSRFDAILWFDASDNLRRQRLASGSREAQVDRFGALEPGENVLRVSAEGTVSVVAERVWRIIEAL